MTSYRAEDGSFQPVIVAFVNHVFGMHPTTGARLWRYDFDSAYMVRIAIGGDMLYALGGDELVCIHLESGRTLGRVSTGMGGSVPTLLASADRILVARGGEVRCFSRDGRLLWEDLFKGEGAGPVALAYAGGVAQADTSA